MEAPEEAPPRSPFDSLGATGLILQSLLGGIGALVAARLFPPLRGSLDDPAASMALFYLGFGLVVYFRATGAGIDPGRLFGPPPSRETARLATVAVPLGLLSIAGFWVLFLPISYGAPDFVRSWIERSNALPAHSLGEWCGQLVVAAMIAPVVEEVFFRGLLLQRLARRWGTRRAVIASSALFAICHFELLGHFLFAVVMCALYLRTRSLWAPIAAHALNNLLASLTSLPDAIRPERADAAMTVAKFRSEWWMGLLLLVVGVALLEGYRRRFWRGISLTTLLTTPHVEMG